jgi:hypothetical protein
MAEVKCCPTCGFPVPDDSVAARLAGKQRTLYETVKAAGARGITTPEIMTALYADDPTGGPESNNIVSVMVRLVNLHIDRYGVVIRGQSGPGSYYRLITTPMEK